MEEKRTYEVGPVDLYNLPFAVCIGDLLDNFMLSQAYYSQGLIETWWVDGLGRKNRGGAPKPISEGGLASTFKKEELEKAKDIFNCRNEHQKSLATWLFVGWRGIECYLIVRESNNDGNYRLEWLSIDSLIKELSFSNFDELLDKLPDHYILNSTPSAIISDLLVFISNLLGVKKEVVDLQKKNDVIMLSRENEVLQINRYESSGTAYVYRWKVPVYGYFEVPKIKEEEMELGRLDDRLAYYISSGYTELPPIKVVKKVSLEDSIVQGEDKGDEENTSQKKAESDILESNLKNPKPISKKQLELSVFELLAKLDLIEINEDLHLYYTLGQTETDKIPNDLTRQVKQLNNGSTLLAGFNFKLEHDHYYLIGREGIVHFRKENSIWEKAPSLISADENYDFIFFDQPVKTKDAFVLKMYWSSNSRSTEHNLSNYYLYLDASSGEIKSKKILL